MRNEAVDGMSGEWGATEGESRRGSARVTRRRAAGPRPVRPAAAAPAVRPAQPMRPASRTAPVAVVVPLFGEPARERTLARPVGAPGAGVRSAPVPVEWPVRVVVSPAGEAVRRFLSGLALVVAVAVTVVLLGLVAALAGEARGGGVEGGVEGGPSTTVMVSPEGGAATR